MIMKLKDLLKGVSVLETTADLELDIQDVAAELPRFDLILNTVPVLLFPQANVQERAVILELASKPGITGSTVIDARGLPGKMAPEESGKLIAKTFIRLCV